MFNNTRYGHYSQKTYNNDTPATLKLLGFVAVVCIFGGAMYALFAATNSWTQAVGATWTPGNNDTLIHELGGAIGKAIILVAGVVSGLLTLALLPWFIRNMRVALNAPIPGASQRYNVIDQDQVAGYVDADQPGPGLLIDQDHQEHYIDVDHQLTAAPAPFAQRFTPSRGERDEAEQW